MLLDGERHVNEEVVNVVHEGNKVSVPCVEPIRNVVKFSM